MGDSWKQEVRRCEQSPTDYLGPGATADQCEQVIRPRAEDYIGRTPLDLGSELDARGLGLVVVLIGAAMVMGATFSGADWSSGAMGTQLVFEPRRLRVWVAKAAAVVVSTTLAAAVLMAVFWGALYAVAGRRVAQVTDGDFPAGGHTTTWQTAEAPRAGVYFARFLANGRAFTKRVVVAP